MRLSRSTTITILGTDTLAEDILARLLEREGYNVRHLEAHPRVSMEGLLDGVDLLLTAPGLNAEVRGAFLKAMRSPRKTAAIPVLTISSALKVALLDELSAGAPWHTLFGELVGHIGAALAGAAASAKALVTDCHGAEFPPAPRRMRLCSRAR